MKPGASRRKRSARTRSVAAARPRRRTRFPDRLDPGGMGDRIESFPAHLRAGVARAQPALPSIEPIRPRRLVVFGMGGSAIAGDLLRALADREGSVPVHVVRQYEPPAWITPEDFLVFSSYSGETEETLSAFHATRRIGAPSCAITTGGTLGTLAARGQAASITLPGGHPPRAALGLSFSSLSCLAGHLGIVGEVERRLLAAAAAVDGVVSESGRDVVGSRNPAKQLAIRLEGRAALILANGSTLAPVALRWKGQFNENAKQLAWASPLPEMNHNEVDSFVTPKALVGRLAAVVLRDPDDSPRIEARCRWLGAYLTARRVRVETVHAKGDDFMTRLMTATVFGDFVSYYLALQNGADPSALPGVEALKKALAR